MLQPEESAQSSARTLHPASKSGMTETRIRHFPASALLRVTAGGGILWFVISRADLGQLSLSWDARASFGFVSTVVIIAIAQGLSAVRWKLILGEDAGAPLGYLLRIYLVGLFFSLFLPTSIGGDAVRAVFISRTSSNPVWAVSTILFERALGLLAMVLILAVGVLFAPTMFRDALSGTRLSWNPTPVGLGVAVIVVVLGSVAILVIARHPKLRRVIEQMHTLSSRIRNHPREFGAALFISFLVQAAYVLAWYQLAVALRLPTPLGAFLVFVPFVSIAAMLPVTIAGIGLREGTAALLLASHGVAAADAVAYSLLYFAAFLIMGVVGGVAFASGGLRAPGQRTASSRSVAPVHRVWARKRAQLDDVRG